MFWLLLGLVPLLLSVTQARDRVAAASLSAAEVRGALSWAASGSPAPYPLRGSDGRTVGGVYTPYVRLAISARVARDEGQPLRAEQVTPADIDPLYGTATHGTGWWYIGLRLDVTSYLPGQHDFDVVLIGDEDAQTDHLDAGLATAHAIPLWIGKGRGMAYRPLKIGIKGDDAVWVVAGVDPERLRAQLPVRVVVVDRNRGPDPVIVEGVITAPDVAAWK